MLAKKHDVIGIRIIDPTEIELPNAGILNLVDPETGEYFTVNSSSRRIRNQYNELALAKESELEERFKKMKVDLVTLRSDQSYVKELMKFFKKRIKEKVMGKKC